MRRPICEDDLHAYVDEALDEDRRSDVEDYLASNADAAARVASYRNQCATLRASLDHVTREALPIRLNLRHIVEDRRHPRSFSGWQVGVAASIFLLVGGTAGWVSHDMMSVRTAGIAALAEEASASYEAFAKDNVHPVEFRPQNGMALAELASAAIGASAEVPDLSPEGYRLMGGRVIPTPHGSAFMWMYDDDKGTRIVMISRKMQVDRDAKMHPGSSGVLNSWSWATGGIGYSLVGPRSADYLNVLANQAKQRI